MEKIKTFARKLRAVFNIIKLRTFLKHIEFEIVEHCNLNCKGCSHFSNICEQKFIDVGISRIDNKLYGDVDYEEVANKAAYITPVPGGVGPMTVYELMDNVYEANNQLT